MPKEFIFSENAPEPIGPYCQAVKVKDMLFLSGQLPINPKTNEMVEGGIQNQIRQIIENITAVLTAAGGSIADIVKTTIFITDMQEFGEINKIYSEYFNASIPARSCVEVSNLPKQASIEMEAIAIINVT